MLKRLLVGLATLLLVAGGAAYYLLFAPKPPSGRKAESVVLTVDGIDMGVVEAGDIIRVQASQHVSRFVRLRERHYFYRSLLDRLEPRVQVRHQPDHKQL